MQPIDYLLLLLLLCWGGWALRRITSARRRGCGGRCSRCKHHCRR
ncbi:MAG: hypothetical protein DBX52_06015 [Clostridiales bacterium]|nr:MAG: hypothetical protein DBX52_06015 [Clostridiales bacterium]